MGGAHQAVEAVARASYGRLLAYLSSETRDVAGAEDALGEALLAALTSWPSDGVPKQPEAWLLTAARHRVVDQARRTRVRSDHMDTIRYLTERTAGPPGIDDSFPDRRVELLFVCAHPAIDPAMHAPLMLQTVLGLDAARIAQAFLVPPPEEAGAHWSGIRGGQSFVMGLFLGWPDLRAQRVQRLAEIAVSFHVSFELVDAVDYR
jgi:RNA polymerase sigma-70 factor (ECF subfamily)